MSDEQLLAELGPCLDRCPPIDIQVFNDKQAKIKLQKDEEKRLKKLEKTNQKLLEKQGLPATGQVDSTVEERVSNQSQGTTQTQATVIKQMKGKIKTPEAFEKLMAQMAEMKAMADKMAAVTTKTT